MTYSELPKKFRLKFGNLYYNNNGNLSHDVKFAGEFSNTTFTENSLHMAMIEKGVLEVEDLTKEKRWRVFMKVFEGRSVRIKYLTTHAGNWWWVCGESNAEAFKSLDDLKQHMPLAKVWEPYDAGLWTMYAEEFEVETGG